MPQNKLKSIPCAIPSISALPMRTTHFQLFLQLSRPVAAFATTPNKGVSPAYYRIKGSVPRIIVFSGKPYKWMPLSLPKF
jgi:hypothetical protein